MAASKGRCVCGSVRFEIDDCPAKVGLCHCGTCRRWGGGLPLAAVNAKVRLTEEGDLRWWRSSDWNERGFCGSCGSSLFARSPGAPSPEWTVAVGALESEDGLRIARHIFYDDKADFYELADDAPRATGAEFTAEVLLDIARQGGGRAFLEDALERIRKGGNERFYSEVTRIVEAVGLA